MSIPAGENNTPEREERAGRGEASAPAESGRYQGRRLVQAERGPRARRFWSNYGYLFITLAVVLLVFRVLLQLAWVPSGSMETTIPEKTLLISWRLPYLVGDPQPQRGDIVTFWDEERGKILVKRVIALPGEEISFRNGGVYIDGEELEEDYLPAQEPTQSPNQSVFQVPEGCFFAMGDNRASSLDSRYLSQPYIPMSAIRARALLGISVTAGSSWQGIRVIA